jgi:protocatechuate 3,4-dioxygenase beta subunit
MDRDDQAADPKRRRALIAGGLGASAMAFAACARQPAEAAGGDAPAAGAKPTAAPALTPQTTEGPYYFDARQVRADITEGLAGIPVDLRFRVLDETGAPVPKARVDVWHCNAAGLYSGYAGQGDDRTVSTEGKTFLRGTQTTGADGVVVFQSIYPGWYRGRTTHIHFKVILGERHVLTSQFTLPDALSEFLYTEVPAYRRASLRDTLNSNDGIALQAGDRLHGCVREDADHYVVTLDVAVDRDAATTDQPPVPAAGPPPRGGGRPPRGPEGGPMQEAPMTGTTRIDALVPGKP